jgi:hypothetical protein
MLYYNKEEWEIVREMRDHNPLDLTVKQQANKLGLNESTVYKWGENPEFSGSPIPKKYIVIYCLILSDFRLIDWYAYQVNHFIKPIEPSGKIDGNILDNFFDVGSSFGSLSKEIKEALADGKIDSMEATKILALLPTMIKEIRTLQEELKIIISS